MKPHCWLWLVPVCESKHGRKKSKDGAGQDAGGRTRENARTRNKRLRCPFTNDAQSKGEMNIYPLKRTIHILKKVQEGIKFAGNRTPRADILMFILPLT